MTRAILFALTAFATSVTAAVVTPVAGYAQETGTTEQNTTGAAANGAAPAPATEFDTGGMVLELNAAEDSAVGGCQLTMVTSNETGQPLARAAWQVAVFDQAGVVRGLPILDFGALPAGKTRVALFELPGRTCSEIARIVVNDVADCRLADGSDAPDLCLSRLTARSLGTIAFGL